MTYDELMAALAAENQARIASFKRDNERRAASDKPPILYDQLPNPAISAARAEAIMREAGCACRDECEPRCRVWTLDDCEVSVLIHQHGHPCAFRRAPKQARPGGSFKALRAPGAPS